MAVSKVERYIQCGVFALRAPNGDFLPSQPLFMKVEDAKPINERTGLTYGEEVAALDFAKFAASKFGEYVQGVKKAERERKKKGATT